MTFLTTIASAIMAPTASIVGLLVVLFLVIVAFKKDPSLPGKESVDKLQ